MLIGGSNCCGGLSVLSYNVLLPNSVDGWWNYKMYLPPLTDETYLWSTWEYRRELLKNRIEQVDADVVCLQEVSPVSFEEDFNFMKDIGYDGKEMFKKGRFRPATFWKTSKYQLVDSAVHKDRTLLTVFQTKDQDGASVEAQRWYVLNCHLQAGKEGSRRLRQINEGVRAAMTFARKVKEKSPESELPLIVCGDFNGGQECGAVRYLEDGFVDETFIEDGEPITSSRKALPLQNPLTDVVSSLNDRPAPATLVVPELISFMVQGQAYENPTLSEAMVERLTRIYYRVASHEEPESGKKVMNCKNVEDWLIKINLKLGRGSEFREAAKQMAGAKNEAKDGNDDAVVEEKSIPPAITLPEDGILSLQGFLQVYEAELKQGKFWGIAHDLAVLGEPVPDDTGVFQARYDRMYYSSALETLAVQCFESDRPCPNDKEPSDHLPVAAAFQIRHSKH